MPDPQLPLDQVLIGDCLEILPTLPPESVDVVFADPPYNLQLRNELWRPNLTLVDGVDDAWDQFSNFAEYDRFTEAWLSACRRVLKKTGTLWVIGSYHNIYRVGAVLQNLGYWILNDIVWVKLNPMPNFRGVRFTNAHETLLWAQKERGATYTFNHHALKELNDGLQMRSDWYLPLCTGRERLRPNGVKAHTTQKPESLLYRVLTASTRPGDVVLDPFFGTGTTGAVARLLGRHYLGIERDPAYADLARRRIEAVDPANPAALRSAPGRRDLPRLPFGLLLEAGLLRPGQTLSFGPHGPETALVLADGSLEYNGKRGSIHAVARLLHPGPCNGWQCWYAADPETGQPVLLDTLRERLRAALTSPLEDLE